MDLGVTTFLFLIINCTLLVLGIVKIVIIIILIFVSIFTFAHIKEASFCAYISNGIIYSLNGIAIFILGLLAGNKNNIKFLNTYQVLILILILSKFYSLHHINHLKEQTKQNMIFSLSDLMFDQRDKIMTSSKVDDIQRSFQCCGTDGPGFWTQKDPANQIPKSCCIETVDSCNASNAFKDGCVNKTISQLPHTLFKIYRITMIPAFEIILLIIGLLLIIMIIRTSSNSLA